MSTLPRNNDDIVPYENSSRDLSLHGESKFDNEKAETSHVEDNLHLDSGHIINEDLVRAENEDKVTKYLLFLISIAAVAGFLFGYDTAIIGSALPMVGTDLGHILSHNESEMITAGCTLGAIFGASILGGLADKLGRKMCMGISDIFFTVGAILLAASVNVPMAIIARIILGVGVGGAAVIGPLYITELAPTHVRGRMVGTCAFFIPFGQVVASALGAIFQAAVPYRIGWRLLFALGVIPSIVQGALLHFLPESPRVLLGWGRHEEAKVVYQKIYKGASDDIIDFKLKVTQNVIAASTRLQREYTLGQRVKLYWSHKPYRRAIIAVSGLQAFGQLTGFNTLLYYSGTIFGLLGLKNSSAAGLIPSGGNAFCVLIGMSIVDRVGRRKLLVMVIPGMIVGLVWALISFYFLSKPTGGQLVANYAYSNALVGSVLGAILLFTVSFGFTYSHIVWYQSEFLALEIRAAGSAIATTSCWLANLVVSLTYLTQLNSLGAHGTYALYTGFIVMGYIFVYFCYPETKGLSVDETGHIFQEDFGVKRADRMLREKQDFSNSLRDQGQRI